MLQARTAEWVIIDLVRDGELSRAVVAGPDVAPDQMIAGDKAPPAPLHGQVLETGQSAVHPFILDENALGITRSGQPVLTVLGAGSLLSVPLRAAGITAGVLTLVRPPEQAAFDLSDLRILEEIGDLVALARRNERRYQHRTETVSAPQASLLPQAPVRLPGVTWAGAYRPGTLGAEAGGDFYDLFTSGSGWGLVLGDVSGQGEEARGGRLAVRDHPAGRGAHPGPWAASRGNDPGHRRRSRRFQPGYPEPRRRGDPGAPRREPAPLSGTRR